MARLKKWDSLAHDISSFLVSGKIVIRSPKNGGERGFIYVAKIGNGLYKIGKTSDPDSRLKALRASNPSVSFHILVRVMDMHTTERALHFIFRRGNVEREIFRMRDQELRKAKKILAKVSCQKYEEKRLYRGKQ